MDAARRLRELADAATPGPWRVHGSWASHKSWFDIKSTERFVAETEHCPEGEEDEADARLIALAPALARGYADALDALAEIKVMAFGRGADYRIHSTAESALVDADRLLGDNKGE